MELVDGYPIIVTDRLRECRDFYGRWFGFQAAFEADWIVVLSSGGRDRPITVAFTERSNPDDR